MEQMVTMKKEKLADVIGLTRKQRIESYAKWVHYWNHIASNYAKGKGFSNLFEQNVVNLLKEQGVFDKDSHVLDIGCGSGAYTLDFAKNCKEVTGVDMSANMLSVLEKRCKDANLSNIMCKQILFEDLPETEQYDLAFASMCPAICDHESLMKFERLSKQYCCLLTVAKGSVSPIRKALRSQLTNERLKGLSPDVIHQFDLLYEMGRYPNIQFFHYTADTAMPFEQAFETYKIYYDIFGFNKPEHHETIGAYLNSVAENGVCKDKITYHMAVMWWKTGYPSSIRKEEMS